MTESVFGTILISITNKNKMWTLKWTLVGVGGGPVDPNPLAVGLSPHLCFTSISVLHVDF